MDMRRTAIREIGKPTVARINGICVGGGNELQMACDLAVMVDDAFIRHVGLQHGSVPAAGATQWLPIMVGDRRAREIILLCEPIPAQQAHDWGLVNRAVPAAELDATVDEFVDKLADRLPLMTRYAKQQLNFLRDLSWHATIRPRARLARAVDAERGRQGRRAALPRPTERRRNECRRALERRTGRDQRPARLRRADRAERRHRHPGGERSAAAAAAAATTRTTAAAASACGARPVGAYVIRDGEVTWKPAIDPVRLAFLVVAALRLLRQR